jgi:lipopolysaccharide transport system permease protein
MWIVEYRELVRILTISDLKVKYQSSVLGFAWSLINPLLMMLVLYLVFNSVFKSNQENFALYLLIGIISWRFMANGTSTAMEAITGRKSSLVTKIYIPRQALVLSNVLSSFISSLLEFFVLMILLLAFGVKISANILFFPAVHMIYFVMVYGISLALAALYVYYRDLNQIWEVLLQLGFFVSPVCYSISIVPENYKFYYMLNPITQVMQIYRNALLYGQSPSLYSLVYILLTAGILLIVGVAIFKKLERRFAEEL